MTQKIKSIKIKSEKVNQTNIELLKKLDDILDVEYEPEILKRPDGSVISGLEEGQDIVVIALDRSYSHIYYDRFRVLETEYNYLVKARLTIQAGHVFLPEDKHLAEKKAEMLTKQLEIQYEIDRLNAEQGWVADWEDIDQTKYDFAINVDRSISLRVCSKVHVGQFVSKETAEKILKKYSDKEIKQYLGIII